MIQVLYTDDTKGWQIGSGAVSDHPLVKQATLGHPWKSKSTMLYVREGPNAEWREILSAEIEQSIDHGTKIANVVLW